MKKILLLIAILPCLHACATHKTDFNTGMAVQRAGDAIHDGEGRYFAYYIAENSSPAIAVAEIKKFLAEAAKGKQALGIMGPNYRNNFDSYKGALLAAKPNEYAGARVAFVGNPNNFDELKSLSELAGISFKGVVCCSTGQRPNAYNSDPYQVVDIQRNGRYLPVKFNHQWLTVGRAD